MTTPTATPEPLARLARLEDCVRDLLAIATAGRPDSAPRSLNRYASGAGQRLLAVLADIRAERGEPTPKEAQL